MSTDPSDFLATLATGTSKATPKTMSKSKSSPALDALSALLAGTIVERKSSSECDAIGVTIGGAARDSLKKSDPKTYQKLKENACAGLTQKFKLMSVVDEKSPLADLQSIYSIQVRLRELRKEMVHHNIMDVFTVFSSWEPTLRPGSSILMPIASDPSTHHQLIDKYNVTSFENVKRSTAFYMMCGAEFQVENLKWSGEKILASCEDTLRAKILESVELLDSVYHGGPVYFYIMMQLVSTTSDHAMRCIVDKLKRLKLSDFDGENVLHAVTFLRGAITLLKNNNALPHDLRSLLFSIMRGCSTPDFVSFVISLETMVSLSGVIADPNIEFLLTTFEARYTELLGANKWLAKSTPLSGASGFKASSDNPQQAPSDDVICFNCGAIGHRLEVCSKPRDQSHIDKYRSILNNLSAKRSSGSGGGNGSGGRDNSGGRGGRGRNGRSGPADPFRVPPGKDDPHTKTFPSLGERHWCGKCKAWTDHLSAKHPIMDGTSSTPAANSADASTSETPADTPSSPASSGAGNAITTDEDGFSLVQPRSAYRAALLSNRAQLANQAHF